MYLKNLSLSAVVTASIFSATAFAEDIYLYEDPTTHQIFNVDSINGNELDEVGDGFASAKDNDISHDKLDGKVEKLKLKIDDLKSKSKVTSVINKKSPDFLLGKQTKPNFKITAQDDPNMYIKIGTRIQGTFENRTVDNDSYSDAYLRRVRFEITTGFDKYTSFTMDVRNDKANYKDKGEQEFNVGDAYLKIKKPFADLGSLVNFKLYRGKIDVSRTETVKSAYVLHYDRPQVADEAAQFITHNRRGTNIQMYGDKDKKFYYQVAIGDGVYSGKTKDATGSSFSGDDFQQNQFFYGGKVVFSPFDGWEETSRTETYFGKGKHLSFGASYWKSPDINYQNDTVSQSIDHTLLNLEFSAHYESAFIQAEYFSFDGVFEDWGSAETGKSNGWYVTGEYVLPDFYYLSPFARYETWEKFEDKKGYGFTSTVFGANWYLRGNTTKMGLAVQNDIYGSKIGHKKEQRVKLTTQWFF